MGFSYKTFLIFVATNEPTIGSICFKLRSSSWGRDWYSIVTQILHLALQELGKVRCMQLAECRIKYGLHLEIRRCAGVVQTAFLYLEIASFLTVMGE